MEVLVLNKSWSPIGATSVRKSMSMLFSGHARAIDTNTYQLFSWDSWKEHTKIDGVVDDPSYISTPNYSVLIPSVITLSYYNGVPTKNIGYSRRALYRRDNNTCQYCGAKPPIRELTVDHVLPRSKGGKTSWENCVIACAKCNSKKGDRLLHMSGLSLKTLPKKPGWKNLLFPQAVIPDQWKPFIKE